MTKNNFKSIGGSRSFFRCGFKQFKRTLKSSSLGLSLNLPSTPPKIIFRSCTETFFVKRANLPYLGFRGQSMLIHSEESILQIQLFWKSMQSRLVGYPVALKKPGLHFMKKRYMHYWLKNFFIRNGIINLILKSKQNYLWQKIINRRIIQQSGGRVNSLGSATWCI